jgi:hypothetical protein
MLFRGAVTGFKNYRMLGFLKGTLRKMALRSMTEGQKQPSYNNSNNNNNYYYYLLQLGCHPVAVVILHAYKI